MLQILRLCSDFRMRDVLKIDVARPSSISFGSSGQSKKSPSVTANSARCAEIHLSNFSSHRIAIIAIQDTEPLHSLTSPPSSLDATPSLVPLVGKTAHLTCPIASSGYRSKLTNAQSKKNLPVPLLIALQPGCNTPG